MKKSARIAGIVFLVLSLADVICLALGFEAVHPWLKPLLIPSLAAAALLALLPEFKGRQTTLLAIGLFFHFAGDVLLLLDGLGFVWFALGLGAFLIGHFFYLAVLLSGLGPIRGWKEILCLIVPIILTPFILSQFDVTGAMRIAVCLYCVTLLYLVSAGALWLLRGRCPLGWRIVCGGLLFIISDGLIALNSFAGVEFPLRHAIDMATYVIAEWLLVSGMVLYQLKSSHIEPDETA